MEAQLKKVSITSAKFDSTTGKAEKEEYATLTLEVPMSSTAQTEAIRNLFGILKREWVTLTVEDKQTRIATLKLRAV